MNFSFQISGKDFWTTFDELAALPKPRRAILSFFGLSILTSALFALVGTILGEKVTLIGHGLSSKFLIVSNHAITIPDVMGILFSVFAGYLWLCVLVAIKKVSLRIGSQTT